MRGSLITKELIEGIVRNDNTQYVETVNDRVYTLVSFTLEELSKTNPFVNFDNTILQPVNELMTGALTDISQFVYFLGIDNAQLEINTMTTNSVWKKWKDIFVYAWKHRKDDKKKKRKKKKDTKAEEVEYQPKEINPEKYNILSLIEDITYSFANQLSQTSMVYNEGKRIRILGKEDFGTNAQIVIYPVLYNGHDYKFFIDQKNGFLNININQRIEKINEKADIVGGDVLKDIIRVFNVLFYNANKTVVNQIFVESLVCSCPNDLFTEDSVQTFLNIINYLSMTDIKNIPSIINPDKTISTDRLCGQSVYGYKKMIDKLIEMK